MSLFSKLCLLVLFVTAAHIAGCAQAVIGTPPSAGIVYSGKGVEADLHGEMQKIVLVAQNVLQRHGFQTSLAQSSDASKEQNIDARNTITGATVHIVSTGHDSSHVEVIATEGKLCWNMDYAGQILLDISQSHDSTLN